LVVSVLRDKKAKDKETEDKKTRDTETGEGFRFSGSLEPCRGGISIVLLIGRNPSAVGATSLFFTTENAKELKTKRPKTQRLERDFGLVGV
jgi:hypothetical protein